MKTTTQLIGMFALFAASHMVIPSQLSAADSDGVAWLTANSSAPAYGTDGAGDSSEKPGYSADINALLTNATVKKVHLKNGTYAQTFTIPAGKTVEGEDNKNTVIKPPFACTVPIIVAVNGGGATLKNVAVTRSNNDGNWVDNKVNNGVFLQGQGNATVDNCRITNNCNGIGSQADVNVIIKNSYIAFNRTGMNFDAVSSCVITDNNIANNSTLGITWYCAGWSTIADGGTRVITGNSFVGNWYGDIDLRIPKTKDFKLDISDNTFSGVRVSSSPSCGEPGYNDQIPSWGYSTPGHQGTAKPPAAAPSINATYLSNITKWPSSFNGKTYCMFPQFPAKVVETNLDGSPKTTVAAFSHLTTNVPEGSTIRVFPGEYPTVPNMDYTYINQKGWYLPLPVKGTILVGIDENGNDITDLTKLKATIYGDFYTKNGNLPTQNQLTIIGDNVTVKGLRIMPKLEANKAIEVLGKNFNLKNVKIECNTLGDYANVPSEDIAFYKNEWCGSIYFNPQSNGTSLPGDIGTAVIENVLLDKGYFGCREDEANAGKLTFKNFTINYRGCGNAPTSGIISANKFLTFDIDNFVCLIDNTVKNIQTQISDRVPAGTIVELAEGTYKNTISIEKAITVKGAGDKTKVIIEAPADATNSSLATVALGSGAILENLTVSRATANEAEWNSSTISSGVSFRQNLTAVTTLRNCVITHNRNGVYANNTDHVVIENNKITENRTGINFANGVGFTISGNEISNNTSAGFYQCDNIKAGGSVASAEQLAKFKASKIITGNAFTNNWYGQIEIAPSMTKDRGWKVDFTNNTFNPGGTVSCAMESGSPAYGKQIPTWGGGNASAPANVPTFIVGNYEDFVTSGDVKFPGIDATNKDFVAYPHYGPASLAAMINNAPEGSTIKLYPGNYPVTSNKTLTLPDDTAADKQTGWYLPILKKGIKLIGVDASGAPVSTEKIANATASSEDVAILYGDEYSVNGNYPTQNFITIAADDVTVEGLVVMPKIEANKTIHVRAKNAALKNLLLIPNTITKNITKSKDVSSANAADDLRKNNAGSIYFGEGGHKDIGNAVVENVTVTKGFIAIPASNVDAGAITLRNTVVDFTGSDYATADPTDPYYMVRGNPNITYTIDGLTLKAPANMVSLQKQIFAHLNDMKGTFTTPVTVELGEGTFTSKEMIEIKDPPVTIIGAGKDKTILTYESSVTTPQIQINGTVTDFTKVAQDITLRGFKMTFPESKGSYCINFRKGYFADIVLDDMSFAGSSATGTCVKFAGAVRSQSLTVSNSNFTGVNATGIYGPDANESPANFATFTITNSAFKDLKMGFYCKSATLAKVSGCTFDNAATVMEPSAPGKKPNHGGAKFTGSGNWTIDNCIFKNNKAPSVAISTAWGTTVTITNNTFEANNSGAAIMSTSTQYGTRTITKNKFLGPDPKLDIKGSENVANNYWGSAVPNFTRSLNDAKYITSPFYTIENMDADATGYNTYTWTPPTIAILQNSVHGNWVSSPNGDLKLVKADSNDPNTFLPGDYIGFPVAQTVTVKAVPAWGDEKGPQINNTVTFNVMEFKPDDKINDYTNAIVTDNPGIEASKGEIFLSNNGTSDGAGANAGNAAPIAALDAVLDAAKTVINDPANNLDQVVVHIDGNVIAPEDGLDIPAGVVISGTQENPATIYGSVSTGKVNRRGTTQPKMKNFNTREATSATGGGMENVIMEGGGQEGGLEVAKGTTTRNTTIKNYKNIDYKDIPSGGTVYVEGELIDCTVEGNTANYCAGVNLSGGKMTNCTIRNNKATMAVSGLVVDDLQGKPVLDNVTVSENDVAGLGTVYVYGGTNGVSTKNVRILNNTYSGSEGYGTLYLTEPVMLDGLTITGNKGVHSAAVYVDFVEDKGIAILDHAIISDNANDKAAWDVANGVINTAKGSLEIKNSLITGNTNTTKTASKYLGYADGTSKLALTNCTISKNSPETLVAKDAAATLTAKNNIIWTSGGDASSLSSGNIVADPKFANEAEGNFRLTNKSVDCIDKIANIDGTDLAGISRAYQSNPLAAASTYTDYGAYEFDGKKEVVLTGAPVQSTTQIIALYSKFPPVSDYLTVAAKLNGSDIVNFKDYKVEYSCDEGKTRFSPGAIINIAGSYYAYVTATGDFYSAEIKVGTATGQASGLFKGDNTDKVLATIHFDEIAPVQLNEDGATEVELSVLVTAGGSSNANQIVPVLDVEEDMDSFVEFKGHTLILKRGKGIPSMIKVTATIPDKVNAGNGKTFYAVPVSRYIEIIPSGGDSIDLGEIPSRLYVYGKPSGATLPQKSVKFNQLTYTSNTPSVATIDNETGALTIHQAGIAAFTAVSTAEHGYASVTQRFAITVQKAVQLGSVNFDTATKKASLSNKLPEVTENRITWSTSNPSVAVIDQTALVTERLGGGTYTINAYIPETANYQPGTLLSQPLTVSGLTPKIDVIVPGTAIFTKGMSIPLQAETESKGAVTYQFDGETPSTDAAEIIGNFLYVHKFGNYKVKATVAAYGLYKANTSGAKDIKISPEESITILPIGDVTYVPGKLVQVTATTTGIMKKDDNGAPVYAYVNPADPFGEGSEAVKSLDVRTGLITLPAVGSATKFPITVSVQVSFTGQGANTVSESVTFRVINTTDDILFTESQHVYTYKAGGYTLSFPLKSVQGNSITYSTDNSDVAVLGTLSTTQAVTAGMNAGTATIRAVTAAGNGCESITRIFPILVKKGAVQVNTPFTTPADNNKSLIVDGTMAAALADNTLPAGATLTWGVSDPTIAAIGAEGKITALKAGTFKVIAQVGAGTNTLPAVFTSVEVTVGTKVPVITVIDPLPAYTFEHGLRIDLSSLVSNTGDGALSFVLKTDDGAGTGTGTIIGDQLFVTTAGTFNITAKSAATGRYAGTTADIAELTVGESAGLIASFAPIADVPFALNKAITLNATANIPDVAFTFSSENEDLANYGSLDAAGVFTLKASAFTATLPKTIQFTVTASVANYEEATATQTLTILPASYGDEILPPAGSYVFGGTLVTLNGTSVKGNAVTYTSGNDNVVKLTGTSMSFVGAGSTYLTATSAAGNGYESVTRTFHITVEKADIPGTVTAIVNTKNAALDNGSGFTATWRSANPAIATIDAASGVITDRSAGATTMIAYIGETANYKAGIRTTEAYTVTATDPTLVLIVPATVPFKEGLTIPLQVTTNSKGAVSYQLDPANEDASIIGNLLYVSKPGSYSVKATIQADGLYKGMTTTTASEIVVTPDNAMVFLPVGEVNYAPGKLIRLTATSVNPAAGVTYKYKNDIDPFGEEANTLDQALGVITLPAGDFTFPITVTVQALAKVGDDQVAIAEQTFSVVMAEDDIDFGDIKHVYVYAEDLDNIDDLPTKSRAGNDIVYSTTDENVIKLFGSKNNSIMILGAGIAAIKAVTQGGHAANGITRYFPIVVKKAECPTVTFSENFVNSMNVDEIQECELSGVVDGASVTWSVSDPMVASITSDGVVTALKKGKFYVIAQVGSTDDYKGCTVISEDPVEVSPLTPALSWTEETISLPYQPGMIIPLSIENSGDGKAIFTITESDPKDIGFIIGNELFVTGAGTFTIEGGTEETSRYSSAVLMGKLTVEIGKISQNLTFAPVGDVVYVPGRTIPLNAYSAQGGTMTYSIVTVDDDLDLEINGMTGVITMPQSTEVTFPQTVIVKASAAATESYAATEREQSFTILDASGDEIPDPSALTCVFAGTAPTFKAVTTKGNNTITYTPSTSSVMTFSDNIATIAGAGVTSVKAQSAAGNGYGSITRYFTITVEKASRTPVITLDPTGGTYSVLSSVAPSVAPITDNPTVTWSVSDAGIASIAPNGVTTGLKAGSVAIIAHLSATANYKEETASSSIAFTRIANTVSFSLPTPVVYRPYLQIPMFATSLSRSPITYSLKNQSDDAAINGNILSVSKVGTYTIVAKAAATDVYNEKSAEAEIVITKADQTVTFADLGERLFIKGQTLSLNASAFDKPVISYVIEPAALAIASLSGANNSVLTFVGSGTVTIKATAALTDNYNAGTAISHLTILPADDTIELVDIVKTWNKTPIANQNLPVNSAGGNAVKYTSSNSEVVSIAGGTEPALDFGEPGESTITATTAPAVNNGYKAVTQTFKVTVNKAEQNINFTGGQKDYIVGNNYELKDDFDDIEEEAEVTFNLPSNGYAVVNPDGAMRVLHATETTIFGYAFFAETKHYNAAQAAVRFTTKAGSQTVTISGIPESATFKPGLEIPLYATATSGYPVTFSVEIVGEAGAAEVLGHKLVVTEAGEFKITATQDGIGTDPNFTTADYNTATAAQNITIGKASQEIFFALNPVEAVYGDAAFDLNGYATSELDVTYASLNKNVATITSTKVGDKTISKLTVTGAGSAVITASQTGNANYNAATAKTQTLNVQKATPRINIANSNIALTYAVTKATGSIGATITGAAGDITTLTPVYTSSNTDVVTVNESGTVTVVNAGTATVTVSFIGDANYNAAQEQLVSVLVNKAARTLSFATPANGAVIEVGQTVTLSANDNAAADEQSNIEYVYTVSDNQKAEVISNNTGLSVKAEGEFTISLYAKETKNYLSGTADRTVNGGRLDQTLRYTNYTDSSFWRYNDPALVLEAETIENVTPAKFSIINNKPVKGMPEGVQVLTLGGKDKNTLFFTAIGTATVKVDFAATPQYNAFSYEYNITVDRALRTLELRLNDPTIVQLTDERLPVTVISNVENDSYIVTSSVPAVAEVIDPKGENDNCHLLFHQVGNTVVSVKSTNDAYYYAAEDKVSVIVRKAEQWIEFPVIAGSENSLENVFTYNSSKAKLPMPARMVSRDSETNPGFYPNPMTVRYTSSNPNVVSFDGYEMVITGAGEAVITASQEGDIYYAPATDVYRKIVVKKGTQKIEWPFSPMITAQSQVLSAAAYENNINIPALKEATGAALTYTIKKTAQADGAYFITRTGDQVYPFVTEGMIYAKRSGNITIDIYAPATANYNEFTQTVTISVTTAAQTIDFMLSKTNFTFEDADLNLDKDRNGTTAANVTPNELSDPASYNRYEYVTYYSSNPDSVQPVKENGRWVLKIKAATDNTEIWAAVAEDANHDFSAAISNRIMVTVKRAAQQLVGDDSATLNNMYTLDKTVLATKSDKPVSVDWTVKTPETASLTGTELSVDTVGVVRIEVYAPQTPQYEAAGPKTYEFFTVGANQSNMAAGAEIFVQENGVGKGDGSTAENATGIFNIALNTAKSGSKVIMAKGTISERKVNDAYTINDKLSLKDGVSLTGGQPIVNGWKAPEVTRDSYTTIDALSKRAVMTVAADEFRAPSLIEYVEFKNGKSASNIGALRVVKNMTVSNCYFYNNESAASAGAVSLLNGTVINCSFVGSKANKGGAIVTEGLSPRVINCFFYGNTAIKDGSAIFNTADKPYIVNNTIIDALFNANNAANHSAPKLAVTDDYCETINSAKPIKVWNTIVCGGSEGEFSASVTPVNCSFKSLLEDGRDINTTKLGYDNYSQGINPFDPENPGVYAPDFILAAYLDSDMNGYAPDTKSILINRGSVSVYLEAVKGLAPELTEKDRLGNVRVQRGHLDIGAFESAEKGWIKIYAENQSNIYNAKPHHFTNFSIEPVWNTDTQSAMVSYSADGKSWTTQAPADYGVYQVMINAPQDNAADSILWHADTCFATLTIDSKMVPYGQFIGQKDIEWDNAGHTLDIVNTSFYLDTAHADFTLTYTAPDGTWFKNAAYIPYVDTYVAGNKVSNNGAVPPTQNGVYTVTFNNTNPNYTQTLTGDYTDIMVIRPRVIHDENIIISALEHQYDRTSKAVAVSFKDVIPASPVKGVDFDVYYFDARDPVRKLTQPPVAVQDYTVVVEMFGDKADSQLTGHYKGEFVRTMRITSDDLYAQNIPVSLGVPSETSLIFKNANEVKIVNIPVIAAERIPANGQKITIECSWMYSSGLVINNDIKNQSFEAVFNGKDAQMNIPLSLKAPAGVNGEVYLKLSLSQFGSEGANGLMLRAVDPASQTIAANIIDQAGALPENFDKEKTGFTRKSTTIMGPQPVTIGLWMSADNMETNVSVSHQTIFDAPEFTLLSAAGKYEFTKTKETKTLDFWTLKVEKAGYYEFLLLPKPISTVYDGYRFFRVSLGKTVANGKSVKKGIRVHQIEMTSNNPRVETLSAGFVVDRESGFNRSSARYIAVTGGFDESELKNVNTEMIDVIDGVRLTDGESEDQINKRLISIALPGNADSIRTASGATVVNFSRRIVGYYLPSATEMNDSELARGYVDSVMIAISEAGKGTQVAPLYIYVGSAQARGTELEIPATAVELMAFAKRPSFKGMYFKPYVPYKLGKTQKTSVTAVVRIMEKGLPQSDVNVAIKSKIALGDAKKMKAAWKDGYLLDALNADSRYMDCQRARLGISINATYKDPAVRMKNAPAAVMMMVPPKVDSVYLVMLTRHNLGDESTPPHGKYDEPALELNGSFFGMKPSVYLQYKNLKGKLVRVKGKIILSKPNHEMATYANGGECLIPKEIISGKDGRLVVRFPKSLNAEGRLKLAGENARFDVIVESGNGVGGKANIIPVGSFKDFE